LNLTDQSATDAAINALAASIPILGSIEQLVIEIENCGGTVAGCEDLARALQDVSISGAPGAQIPGISDAWYVDLPQRPLIRPVPDDKDALLWYNGCQKMDAVAVNPSTIEGMVKLARARQFDIGVGEFDLHFTTGRTEQDSDQDDINMNGNDGNGGNSGNSGNSGTSSGASSRTSSSTSGGTSSGTSGGNDSSKGGSRTSSSSSSSSSFPKDEISDNEEIPRNKYTTNNMNMSSYIDRSPLELLPDDWMENIWTRASAEMLCELMNLQFVVLAGDGKTVIISYFNYYISFIISITTDINFNQTI